MTTVKARIARNKRLITYYQSKPISIQDLANKYGMTRQAAHQILIKNNIPRRTIKKGRSRKKLKCIICEKEFEHERQNTQTCSKSCRTKIQSIRLRRFNDEQVTKIHRLYFEEGFNGREIAELYNVPRSLIYNILGSRPYIT